jgi:SPP1 gp7 family putative phage head morphogenesis protein
MAASTDYWLKAEWRKNEPIMLAMDELPAHTLNRKLRQLRSRWEKNFSEAAKELAKYFMRKSESRSTTQLRNILRDAGISVKFRMTQAQRDIINAAIAENVSLIKSIPSKYFTEVEGLVMRSVQTGRDLEQLTNDLEKRYHVTRKRASFIARDQNNKATAALSRSRYLELGVNRAVWLHSGGGKEPRPTHLANSGEEFDVKTGWFDPHEKKFIHPGELINCRCVAKPVVEGF